MKTRKILELSMAVATMVTASTRRKEEQDDSESDIKGLLPGPQHCAGGGRLLSGEFDL